MRKYIVQTNNLDKLIPIIEQLKLIDHTPVVLAPAQNILTEKVIFITDRELSDLNLSQLFTLQSLKSSIIFSIKAQNKSSIYIAEKLLGFSSCQFISPSKQTLLPKHIFSIFPKISPGVFEIKKIDDLLSVPSAKHEVFSTLDLSRDKGALFCPTNGPLLPFFSICSIKKIMQYFSYRFIRDIPND